MLSIFIQDGSETAENLEPLVQEKTLSIIELLMDGGMAGQIIIGVLFVLLFTAVYLYFERLFAIKAATDYDVNFMDQIRNNVSSGNLEAAKVLCAQKNTPVSRLTEKGISRIGSPLEDINTAIENAGKLEVYKLEKNVSILATIAGAAPMIGISYLGNKQWSSRNGNFSRRYLYCNDHNGGWINRWDYCLYRLQSHRC